MIELPEAVVWAGQINTALVGKRIQHVIANQSPHKFAWFTGDPSSYPDLLVGRTIQGAASYANHIVIHLDGKDLVISTSVRYHDVGENPPEKHQLLLEFDDRTALSATIQMWGGLWCVAEGEKTGFIDEAGAREKPSPLADAFDWVYFKSLLPADLGSLSAKAFLATEQRIPGLGNGTLQDILWKARIHPRRKMADLTSAELEALCQALKAMLADMTAQGGRDTERDLFGISGGYQTVLSKNTVGQPCPACSAPIKKEAFMGGSVYFCPWCQAL